MIKMNKVLPGHKYIANFLDAPVRLGTVYKMDHKQFVYAMHFNDAYPDVDLSKWIEQGSPGDIKFTDSTKVSVMLGGKAQSKLGKTQVGLKIKKAKTVAGVLRDAVVQTIGIENVKEMLWNLWRDRGFDQFISDYIFVYDQVVAASGTLIYSEESNNEIVLTHTRDEKVTTEAMLGSGEFEYVSNSKPTLEIIRNVAHKPLFKAVRFKKNGQTVVVG